MTNATVSDNYEGRYISTNWGYNQTNREFAKIVEVSDTGKTVVAQLVETETVEGALDRRDTIREKHENPDINVYRMTLHDGPVRWDEHQGGRSE